jgi:CheY-like chemotaxis protein
VPHTPSRAQEQRSLRLLVVDDDELVQLSMGQLLESAGHVPTIVGGGREALAKLRAETFDAVILDMNMPGMDGAETLSGIRAARPELPVILATGRAGHEATALAKRTPKVELLAKPFTIEDLKAMLGRMT